MPDNQFKQHGEVHFFKEKPLIYTGPTGPEHHTVKMADELSQIAAKFPPMNKPPLSHNVLGDTIITNLSPMTYPILTRPKIAEADKKFLLVYTDIPDKIVHIWNATESNDEHIRGEQRPIEEFHPVPKHQTLPSNEWQEHYPNRCQWCYGYGHSPFTSEIGKNLECAFCFGIGTIPIPWSELK